MADFNKGDRIVKMSGVNAGKYGTINSISDSGTLNVTFDGERLPRFCDPERCGKIGLNAKFKVGDRVWFKAPVTGAKVTAKITATLGGEKYGFVDDDGIQGTIEGNAIYPLNSRACNATGDQVIATSGKYKLVYNPLNEGYWFYVGDYGEGMSDANGRSIFGKDKKSVAMAEFKKLVATANSCATNAKFSEGQEVQYTGRTGKIVKAVVKQKLMTPGYYLVESEDGTMLPMPEKLLKVANSRAANASIDDEFPKLKAMGKANAEKYLKDNSQSLIDKYGYPEFVKLAKKIQSIRLKPIKKGRFAGKSGDMTYYVDYTADSWFASKYGKDGTNVTEIQVTGPYVMDPDGKERRHILYYYRSGTESIPAQSSEVRSLVSSIMRGPNVVKQGDAAFAWNACGEDK